MRIGHEPEQPSDLDGVGTAGVSLDMLGFIEPVQKSAQLNSALQELTTRQADIRGLRYRYTDENPEVRRVASQIAELEQSIIPGLARTVIGELATREAELNRRRSNSVRRRRRPPGARAWDWLRLLRPRGGCHCASSS